jgi:beta-phosphoglucomutase-like phosphatase (HAD superfamily)
VTPAHALAIEDSPTGVRSAVAAGCVVVAVPHIATIDASIGAHFVTNTLRDLTLSDLWTRALTGGGVKL